MPSPPLWVPGPHCTGEEVTDHLARLAVLGWATGPAPCLGRGRTCRDCPRAGSGSGGDRVVGLDRVIPPPHTVSHHCVCLVSFLQDQAPCPRRGCKQLQKQSLCCPAFATTCGAQASCCPHPLPSSALAPGLGGGGWTSFHPGLLALAPPPHWDRGTLAPHTHTSHWGQGCRCSGTWHPRALGGACLSRPDMRQHSSDNYG